jgi:hypothetical protein
VHVDYGTILGKHNIRLSGEVLDMQPVSETGSMEVAANCQFRFGILAPYT